MRKKNNKKRKKKLKDQLVNRRSQQKNQGKKRKRGSVVDGNDSSIVDQDHNKQKSKFVASHHIPDYANGKVYSSLFQSSKNKTEIQPETFLCRNTSAKGIR
eukprot:TRINITY_DN13699_c0_g1_i1.p4 TRINITY_DN13699_c0_g1~~TRINITY_DN13699_c0_g1_i1.p4  ORF type:complete len:101 (+),score=5.67 TRINITY_DN13699_c0_g1_i1:48-350(+)